MYNDEDQHRYYTCDAFHQRQMDKAIKKGSMKATKSDCVVYNDEDHHRSRLIAPYTKNVFSCIRYHDTHKTSSLTSYLFQVKRLPGEDKERKRVERNVNSLKSKVLDLFVKSENPTGS